MKKNKNDCVSIVHNITELMEGINEIIESKEDSKQDNILMKNIQKLER